MAQDYGPAQPIADVFKSGLEKVESVLGGATKPARTKADEKVDADYHANMLKTANDSIKANADKERAAKAAPSKAYRKPARKR